MTAPNTDAVEGLVARLGHREFSWVSHEGDALPSRLVNPDGPEAAATITAQAARIAELEIQNNRLRHDMLHGDSL